MVQSDNIALIFRDGITFVDVTGKVNEAEMASALDWFKVKTETHPKFNMCMEMWNMDLPSAGAVKEELSRLGEVFKMLKSIDKCAVISDSGFIRNGAKVEGVFYPGTDIESFEMDEKVKAMAWLREI